MCVCFLSCAENDIKYWIESDKEIDEDIDITNAIPPPDIAVSEEECTKYDKVDYCFADYFSISIFSY